MAATVDIAWGINKNATEEEKKAAFEFISWMAAGKGQEVFCIKSFCNSLTFNKFSQLNS